MQRRFLFLFLLITTVAGQSQELYVRAPRISNWDLQQGELSEVAYWITPGATFIQVDIDFTVSAGNTNFSSFDTLEALLNFELPENAVVTDSWLWIDSAIVKARIQDRWSAEDQFENIVRRNLDPSILTKEFGQQYELKIFPMTTNWNRRARISLVLPAHLDDGRLTSRLSNEIIPANQIIENEVTIHIHQVEGIGDALIDNLTIQTSPDKTKSLLIPKLLFNDQISFEVVDKSYLLQTYEHDGQKYFGLNIDLDLFPKEVAGYDHFLFIFDYSLANNSEPLDVIAETIGTKIESTFKPSDSLAFYGAGDTSFEWAPATEEGIKKLIENLKQSDGFSDLPDVLIEGVRLANTSGADQIFFLSNSSPRWNSDQTVKALSWVNLANEQRIPIHVISFQNSNWSTHPINGLDYANNDFFLEKLAQENGGSFSASPQSMRILSSNFSAFSQRGIPVMRSLDIDIPDGASFATEDIGGSYLGRYFGSDVFEAAILDINNQQVDTTITLIPNLNSIHYPISQQWVGAQIEELTNSLNGGYYHHEYDERIFDIISLSLDTRVLSSYTALLALEPSLGGKVCDDCLVNDPGGQISEDFIFNSLGLEISVSENNDLVPVEEVEADLWKLDVVPNPTANQTQIRISEISIPITSAVVRIYDLSGRILKTVMSRDDQVIHLNVGGLDAGMYFLHIYINGKRTIRKLLVLRG